METVLRLKPGDNVRYGEAELKYHSSGVLEACDPYGCSRFRVYGERVELYPTYPVHRPSRIADCVYVELEEVLIVSQKARRLVYTLAPYDLEVRVSDIVLGYITPLKVKYTVVGDVVDGFLCRYYKGPVVDNINGLRPRAGEAIVEAIVKGSGVLRGIGFRVDSVTLYVGESVSAYTRLEVDVNLRTVTTKPIGRPLEGFKLMESPATQRRLIPVLFTYPA